MKRIVEDIKQFRYSSVLQALISVHEKMGLPYFVDGKTLFLPFFSYKEKKCILTSKLFLEYPSFLIIRFEKVRKEKKIDIDINDVLKWKQTAMRNECQYSIEEIPECLKKIYMQAKEEFEYDQCKDCI